LALARSRLGYAPLTSPVNGVVLVRAAQPGEVAAGGATVLSVGDLDDVWFEGYLPETSLALVHMGRQAEVSVDTLPREKIPWDGFLLSQTRRNLPPRPWKTYKERVTQVYRTKISLANPNRELKQGMPAEAVIYLEGQKP